MVCKEDVVSWFKELESYKRIDAMCTLLNMCLPFELRFIGTYLEELGKRDFQELRGAELRANNPTDLAADIGGANTDPRTRRKMALYVSLLRSCNFACATTLYNAMVSLEQSGLLKGLYGDLLEEILLLYTMALHHPAFTFDQKSHFGDILEKLKLEDQRIQFPEQQERINVVPLPSTDSVNELSSAPVLTTPTGVVSIIGEVTHPPPGLPLPPQYNIGEYIGQHGWAANIIVAPINPTIEVINYQASSSGGAPPSPLVSSPCDSRAASPRSRRRPSRDRSPPPAQPQPPATDPSLPHLAANFENLSVAEMRHNSHMSDERLRELSQLSYHSVEKLNGMRRRTYAPAQRSSSDSGSSGSASPAETRAVPSAPPLPVPYVHYQRPYGYPTPPPTYRPPPPFANGEPPPYPVPGAAPYAGFVPVLYAPPKLSCWNCGAAGHAGHDCKEPSMEEMTRAGSYQLDFGGAPPDHGDK